MGDSGNTRGALGRHPVRTVVALAALALAALAARLAAPGSDAAGLLLVLTCLAALPFAFWSVRWLWRKLTYRVGVRLFISYLLIGLTPFALFAGVALVVGYVLVGQFAATHVRSDVDRVSGSMSERAAGAVRELAAGRAERARELLERPGGNEAGGLREAWLLADGDREWRSPNAAELPVPRWVGEDGWRGEIVAGTSAFLVAAERRGEAVAALLVPLDLGNARAFPGRSWYEVRFVSDVRAAASQGAAARRTAVVTADQTDTAATVRINGRPVPETQVEHGWLAAKPPGGSRWQRLRTLWIWIAGTPRDAGTGKAIDHTRVLAVIKLSPHGAFADLFGSSDRLNSGIRRIAGTMAGIFGMIYLIAVGFAVVMILRVTRATARLTRGASAVARGDLEQLIPVKQRDQLGDLAMSFNAMTASVKTMLVQVAEKERMAREMELAREIQSSLLPPSELSSGPLSVWAHFRPAAEVGGDYFDLFPLAPGRLVVTVGDVAGHGLHTGLLMAMVKSAVATLVEESHTGRALLERLNRLLLGQPIKQRMVSLAIAEIDVARAEVEITSAGHQPAMVLGVDGGAEEVLLASLPLGHPWPDPAPTKTLPFGPGSRLVLYSDGLVEARSAEGVPFGHDRLRDALLANRGAPARDLVGILLAELERHTSGQPLADDLTVVVVEHLAATA
jgi:serine phosphatase RsbU (regulator of sigma subunit)